MGQRHSVCTSRSAHGHSVCASTWLSSVVGTKARVERECGERMWRGEWEVQVLAQWLLGWNQRWHRGAYTMKMAVGAHPNLGLSTHTSATIRNLHHHTCQCNDRDKPCVTTHASAMMEMDLHCYACWCNDERPASLHTLV